jgi:hypothetical protein
MGIRHLYRILTSPSFAVHILASTSVPFRPTTVHLPKLALIETIRIRGHVKDNAVHLAKSDPPNPEDDDDDVHRGMSVCLPRRVQP